MVREMKVNVWVGQSLDGFVARKDGALDWIESQVTGTEDCGLEAFTTRVDALVVDKHTFGKMMEFKEWLHPKEYHVYVLSDESIPFERLVPKRVHCTSECPAALVERLRAGGMKCVWVDGSDAIQRFLRAGLVDQLTINTFPILLGKGISLFGFLRNDLKLTLLKTRETNFEVVQSIYRIKSTRKRGRE